MFRSKFRFFLTAIVSLFLLFSLGIGCAFFYFVPNHPVNIALFKIFYNTAPSKKTLLDFYSPARRDVNNGYAPSEVNEFLIEKISNSNDEYEISAIVHFYVLQAKSHRIGYFNNFQEEVKPKIVRELIRQLENGENLGGKLMLLEEVRSNRHLGKGSVGFSDRSIEHPIFSTFEDYSKWFDEKAAPIVIPKYKEWWNTNLSWEEKKKINPLQDSSISVSHCCG